MDFFNHVTVLLALTVLASQQILKIIPLGFTAFANKYPVFTNIGISIVSTVVAATTNHIAPKGWTGWVGAVALCALVAALFYNNTFGKSDTIKTLENKAYAKKA